MEALPGFYDSMVCNISAQTDVGFLLGYLFGLGVGEEGSESFRMGMGEKSVLFDFEW